MSDWHGRTEVRKGDYGEQIVDEYLKRQGVVPYFPDFDGPHPFDRLCAAQNKRYMCIADVKAKARRTYYPDTGINIRTFDEYSHIQNKYRMDVRLYFVDEGAGSIYGNKLSVLSADIEIEFKGKVLSYPLRQSGIIYFPLQSMITVKELNGEQVRILKQFSQRNYDYPEEMTSEQPELF